MPTDLQPKNAISLDSWTIDLGNHASNTKDWLPDDSTTQSFPNYDEIVVPPPKIASSPSAKLLPVTDMPQWARGAFNGFRSFNRIQSKCFHSAFEDDGNMLLCAPAHTGKTIVAMLAILREIGKQRDAQTGEVNRDAFKILYVAPTAALAREMVVVFKHRLGSYGIQISGLVSKEPLMKSQIVESQIIVATPEHGNAATIDVRLNMDPLRAVIIDGLHSLHDERGAFLESIVTWILRKNDQTNQPVRLIGLSAPVLNFEDVGSFLHVHTKNLYYFDNSYRPFLVSQEFIGITEREASTQLETVNEVICNKVMKHVGSLGDQMVIVVPEEDTAATARYIRDKTLKSDTIDTLVRQEMSSREALNEAADNSTDEDLKDLLRCGFGILTAGMNRLDRMEVEDLFTSGTIRVLVSSITAVGSLPSDTVLVRATPACSPEKGRGMNLGYEEILRILSRPGRPRFDAFGADIVVTRQSELQYYVSLLNHSMPIESRLISKLAGILHTEIVRGNVGTRAEGVEWLGYTFLFTRMLRCSELYGLGLEYEGDDELMQKRTDLIHSAGLILKEAGLIAYDEVSGEFGFTALGSNASSSA